MLADGAAIVDPALGQSPAGAARAVRQPPWKGVFLAPGPGIRAGAELDELSILDVAPTLLYSLDVPIPRT